MIWWWLFACLPDLGPASAQAHAGRCGECHGDHVEAFETSRHRRSASSELFLALQARAEAATGTGSACDQCHAPGGEASVTCLTCHAAAGNQRTADGTLLWDLTGPIRGPFGDTQGSHASVRGDFLVASELCGTCHQVEGRGAFHETPYTHWTRSPAAARGERCQDCHQSAEPGVAAPRRSGTLVDGGPRRPLSEHGFEGLQSEEAEAMLRRGVTLEAIPGGVVVENLAGHALPDGAAFTRELWLEPREGGRWSGSRRPLHPVLLHGGVVTWDPIAADEKVDRGLAPGERRTEWFDASLGGEVCLRFRPVAEALSAGLDLPFAEAVTITCVALPP